MLTSSSPLDPSLKHHLEIYAALGALNSLCAFFRAFIFAFAGLRAAQVLIEREETKRDREDMREREMERIGWQGTNYLDILNHKKTETLKHRYGTHGTNREMHRETFRWVLFFSDLPRSALRKDHPRAPLLLRHHSHRKRYIPNVTSSWLSMVSVINRFSSDQYTIDDSLPFMANILLATLFGLVGTAVMLGKNR